MASEQAPKLNLAANQCIVYGDNPDLNVGDCLHFDAFEQLVNIKSIIWIIGKLRSVEHTEVGHRYIVCFDCETVPNNVTADYAFKKV